MYLIVLLLAAQTQIYLCHVKIGSYDLDYVFIWYLTKSKPFSIFFNFFKIGSIWNATIQDKNSSTRNSLMVITSVISSYHEGGMFLKFIRLPTVLHNDNYISARNKEKRQLFQQLDTNWNLCS